MAPKAKTKTYDVNMRAVVIVGVELEAENFNDAYEKAKALDISDIIEVNGDHNDSSLQVISIGQNVLWNVD